MAKQSYNTVRELERDNSRWFKIAGIVGIAGVLLCFFGFINEYMVIMGIVCLIIGATAFFVAMIRVILLSRQPVRHIYCPYCASKNDVFLSKTELPCDICGRKIGISPYGEAIPLEPMEDDED